MIYLQKNTANTFILELLNTIPTNVQQYFLFEFVFEGSTTQESQWFFIPDIAWGTNNRFNKFQFTESDMGSPNFVDIYSNPFQPLRFALGQYEVYVYATDQPPGQLWSFQSPLVLPVRGQALQCVRGVVYGSTSELPVYRGNQQPTPIPGVYD